MDLMIFGPKTQTIGAVEYYQAKLAYEIGPWELKNTLDDEPEKVFVVDVRGEEAFAQAHIAGAHNIPLAQLPANLAVLPKDRTIVTYCGDITCPLSSRAALELAQKGYRVRHLVGGIAEWRNKGFPVRKMD